MKNSLYNKRHWREYLIYGVIAGILYIIPSWIFLASADYNNTYTVFIGSMLFMFVILAYVYKLTRRRTEYKSAWMMIIAGHMATFVGVAVSVLLTLILCFIYIPGFLSGNSSPVIEDAPAYSSHNTNMVTLMFVSAIAGNLLVSSFVAALGPYALKLNQTRDKTAMLEKHIPSHE